MTKNIDYVSLGKRIKNRRNQLKITQEKLGEICELSAAHIGHIERGTRILSVEVLFRIAQALDISVDYLLFDSVDNNKILNSLSSVIKNADNEKQKQLLNIVRILSENINKL